MNGRAYDPSSLLSQDRVPHTRRYLTPAERKKIDRLALGEPLTENEWKKHRVAAHVQHVYSDILGYKRERALKALSPEQRDLLRRAKRRSDDASLARHAAHHLIAAKNVRITKMEWPRRHWLGRLGLAGSALYHGPSSVPDGLHAAMAENMQYGFLHGHSPDYAAAEVRRRGKHSDDAARAEGMLAMHAATGTPAFEHLAHAYAKKRNAAVNRNVSRHLADRVEALKRLQRYIQSRQH